MTATGGGRQVVCADVLDWAESYEGPKFHALLCDPPYHLGADGFMGKKWDAAKYGIAFNPDTWAALAEHLHPGGFGMAFASSRGWHRLAVAVEDAGLRIHPSVFMLGWVTGSGFPKSTRIDTQVDKAAGAEREIIGQKRVTKNLSRDGRLGDMHVLGEATPTEIDIEAPATPLAQAWAGHRYGLQALKPALEPIIVFQKPYENKPVQDITATGAGSLWIDGARVATGDNMYRPAVPDTDGTHEGWDRPWRRDQLATEAFAERKAQSCAKSQQLGRWPPNLALVHIPPDADGNGGCQRVGVRRVKSGSDCFPYSFKDSLRVSVINDSVDRNATPQEVIINLVVSWFGPCSVMLTGFINFNNNIEGRQVEINEESPLISDDHPLMDVLNTSITQLVSDFKLNFWNGEGFPTGKTFTTMNGQLERITLPTDSNTSIRTKDSSARPLDAPGMRFKFFLADGTGKGNFVSSISDPKFVGAFLATRFPGRFDGAPGLDKNDEFFAANWTDFVDFSHVEPPASIIQQQSSTVKVDNYRCHPSCPVLELGRQSGERPGGGNRGIYTDSYTHSGYQRKRRSMYQQKTPYIGHSDTGTAARFFPNFDYQLERLEAEAPFRYVAKASRGERDAGLEGWQATGYKAQAVAGGRQKCKNCNGWYPKPMRLKRRPNSTCQCNNPEFENLGEKLVRNPHPTVKPIALALWLARLLTPPPEYAPRRLLIPFSGSGSEICAAILSGGFEEIIGIEMEEEYVRIAQARCQFWEAMMKETGSSDPGAILKAYGRKDRRKRGSEEHLLGENSVQMSLGV